MSTDIPELISFKICPYVQRSIIVLNEKNAPFKLTHIDIMNPPDWFKVISPLGKVPVLKVEDQVIFESSVILEYLDETCLPRLHPEDALERARHRSWMEYASELMARQADLFLAADKTTFDEIKADMVTKLQQLEAQLSSKNDYFSDAGFALVDAAFAPMFMRFELMGRYINLDLYDNNSRLADWSRALLSRDSVKHSVTDDFEELYIKKFRSQGAYIRRLMKES